MKKSIFAIALVAASGLLFSAAPVSAIPVTAGSGTTAAVINNGLTQQVSWHCWNTHRYSHRLHRYLHACGDVSGKFKHHTSTSAGLVVHKKAPKATSSY